MIPAKPNTKAGVIRSHCTVDSPDSWSLPGDSVIPENFNNIRHATMQVIEYTEDRTTPGVDIFLRVIFNLLEFL